MAEFVSAWFSYLVILVLIPYVVISIWMKSPAPGGVIYALTFFTGGTWPFIILGAATFLAFISKFDPLGWLWKAIGQAFT